MKACPLWPQDNFTPHGFKTLSKALRPELKEFIFWTASQQLRKQNVEILRVMSFHFCTNALCVWTHEGKKSTHSL